MIKISYIKSDDRFYNISRSLALIKTEITAKVKNARSVVIKPNCITDKLQLAATHVDALEAVLEFIRPHVKGQITLAEGTSVGQTINAFKNYGYLEIQDYYDLAIVDLNTDSFEEIELIGQNGRPWKAPLAKTLLRSDYIISLSPPKTHDTLVYAGAIKNVAVSPLARSALPNFNLLGRFLQGIGLTHSDQEAIRQDREIMNENLLRLCKKLPISLAILDGFETMEGDGPFDGEMVPSHFGIASTDAAAADWLACQLMGIDVNKIGYLSMREAEQNRNSYFVIGDDWQENVRPHRLHHNFQKS